MAHVWTFKTGSHPLNRVVAFCSGAAQRGVVFRNGDTLWGYVEYKDNKPYLVLDCTEGRVALFDDNR
jgi:hypothetical protein